MPNWVLNHLTIYGENAVETLRSLLIENKGNEIGSEFDFDFNKIIPMPDSLRIESGSSTDSCVEMYLTSINPFVDYYGENKVGSDEFLRICRAVQATKFYGKYNDKLSIEEIQAREKNVYFCDEQNEYLTLTKEEILARGKHAVDNVLTYGAMDWYDWSCTHWGTKWNACNTQFPDTEVAEIYFDTAWSPVPQVLLVLSNQHPECIFDYEYAEEQAGYFAGSFIFQAGDITQNVCYEEYSKECYEMYFKLWGGEDEFEFNAKKGTYEYIENEEEM